MMFAVSEFHCLIVDARKTFQFLIMKREFPLFVIACVYFKILQVSCSYFILHISGTITSTAVRLGQHLTG